MKLSDISTITAGYPFRGKVPEIADSRVIAVQMKNVDQNGEIDWLDCVETKLTGKREPYWLKTGDILVAARGSHNYAAMVSKDIEKFKFKALAAPHFFVVSTHHQDVKPEYLAWLLNQSPCQRYFSQNSEGTLTKSIRRIVLENAPIAVPSLDKQSNIINLARTIRQEKQTIEQLLQNGERMLNAIATDLLSSKNLNH